jgi:hypothetical protein
MAVNSPGAHRSAARAGVQQTSGAWPKEGRVSVESCCVTQRVHGNTVIGVALAEIAEILPRVHPLGKTMKQQTAGSVSSCRWVAARDSPASCCLLFGVHPTSLIGVSLAETAETPRGLHPVNETAARPTSWSCDQLSRPGMTVRLSAGGAAIELMPDTPRKRVFALNGAQKLPANRAPSQRLLSFATRKRSAGVPPLCDPARRASLLILCIGTNINSGAPATDDQRFSHQGFRARPLHDPAPLVAPVAVAQQAFVELAGRQARQLGLEVDRARVRCSLGAGRGAAPGSIRCL